MLTVVVEGPGDRCVVEALLGSAEVRDFRVVIAKGGLGPNASGRRRLESLKLECPAVVVYDQDGGSVGDAVEVNLERSGPVLCPAIPTVEAWLFADADALFDALGDRADSLLGRFPLPEQLPYPKLLKSTLLRNEGRYRRLLDSIDVGRAAARSPSLRNFLDTARRLSGLPPLETGRSSPVAGRLDRETLRNLISEVFPSSRPLFRAASGAILSAEQMMQEITDGSELGREYASDILRVARDLLARQAARGATDQSSKR